MIRHTVTFSLKYPAGSIAEANFLVAAKKLKDIPRVNNFECLKQISSKNNFSFGLSMEFESQADYQFYNEHPSHQYFLNNVWHLSVTEFLELDYQVI